MTLTGGQGTVKTASLNDPKLMHSDTTHLHALQQRIYEGLEMSQNSKADKQDHEHNAELEEGAESNCEDLCGG